MDDDSQLGGKFGHLVKKVAKGTASGAKFTVNNLNTGVKLVAAAKNGDVVAVAKILTTEKKAKQGDKEAQQRRDELVAARAIYDKGMSEQSTFEKYKVPILIGGGVVGLGMIAAVLRR
jgi:hypothetical protein